jgi:NAD(P)-dependent dehydrogenase (short-subunit alcohol dehydrogenase family)
VTTPNTRSRPHHAVALPGLSGQVALVTGAARGLGASQCRSLASQGVDLVAIDICAPVQGLYPMSSLEDLETSAAHCRDLGAEVQTAQVDVRDAVSFADTFSQAIDRFGHIDILINNAGICYDGSILDFPLHIADAILDINLRSLFSTTQVVARHMRDRGYGRIINIASATGGVRAIVDGSPYAASKAGVIMATKCWAHDLAPYGITVNAVAPGVVMTGMIEGLAGLDDAFDNPAEAFDSYRQGALLKGDAGIISPDDVSTAVAFLASSAAAGITGQILGVDAGTGAI